MVLYQNPCKMRMKPMPWTPPSENAMVIPSVGDADGSTILRTTTPQNTYGLIDNFCIVQYQKWTTPSGNQTLQLNIPCKWKFKWEEHL